MLALGTEVEGKRKGFLKPLPMVAQPFEQVGLDLMGPFPCPPALPINGR